MERSRIERDAEKLAKELRFYAGRYHDHESVDQRYRHAAGLLDNLVSLHREAISALAELVRLKDGPRDDAYRAAKDAAWDEARAVLARFRESHTINQSH